MLGAQNIFSALTEGAMKIQALALNDAQRIALSEHLGESRLADNTTVPVNFCENKAPKLTNGNTQDAVSSWGVTQENTRFIEGSVARLEANQVPDLTLKWSFAYPNAARARSQPTVHNGVVFVGSQSGAVYALDLDSGCAYWHFQADAEVRSALTFNSAAAQDALALYFGDFNGNVYALDANSGSLLWKVSLDDHPDLTITGSPTLHKDVLYVPLSSREWATAADPGYNCCTFRGGVSAINIADGKRAWTAYTVDPPVARENGDKLRVPGLSPSGAPVWNRPTIDTKRNRLYFGTGENYSSPSTTTSDAVIAVDMETGEIVWTYQSISNDAWNMACYVGGGVNCPEENGPDLDIGASTILLSLDDDRDVILAGQKSGHVFALDPDDAGKLLWRKKLGAGGFVGGVHWGMAAENETLFVPMADQDLVGLADYDAKTGLYSVNAGTGEVNWFSATVDQCAPEDKPACHHGLSAAITAIPGVVFAGAFDGYLKAYDSSDGKMLWEYGTHRTVETVSGEIAHGGSIEADGPIVYDGHVLINSGYSFGGKLPGNVLFVFSVKDN